MKQDYSNHIRYYPSHHFIFLPFMFALMVVGIVGGATSENHKLTWWLFALLSFCILWLSVMLRQHYALGNQNRIVRLEFRLRYFELFGKNSKTAEENLSFKQIAALRFADDEEFKTLLDRSLKESLSPKEIKQAIKNWQGDYMRV
ncbi:MAG: DUF6526 family protein [Chitinophagaceae bacterium]